MLASTPSIPSIAELRASIASIAVTSHATLPFGITDLDRHLTGGGLATDSVHEIARASSALTDDAAATLFTAGLAARFAARRDAGQPPPRRAGQPGFDPRLLSIKQFAG